MTDEFYNSVSLLLHGDGANGSTTFTDSSPNGITLTRVYDPVISTAQSKFGGASIEFGYGNGFLKLTTANDVFRFGSGDLTIEFFVRINVESFDYADEYNVFCNYSGITTGTVAIQINKQRNLVLRLGGSIKLTTTETLVDQTWHHVALTRDSGLWRFFIDGAVCTATSAFVIDLTSGGCFIGEGFDWYGYGSFQGHLDEVRITKGVARYTESFTPPTEAFPNSAPVIEPYATVVVTAYKPSEIELPPGARVLVSCAIDELLAAIVVATGHLPVEWTRLTPGRLLPSYTFDGTSLSFDIADLVGVSAAEAHTTTGDWRDVTQGLMMRVQDYLASLRASQVKNCFVSTTNDFTYNHATLGNVLRRTMAVQFAFQYADAYIPDEV